VLWVWSGLSPFCGSRLTSFGGYCRASRPEDGRADAHRSWTRLTLLSIPLGIGGGCLYFFFCSATVASINAECARRCKPSFAPNVGDARAIEIEERPSDHLLGHFTNFAVVLLSRRLLTVRTLIHPHVLLRPPVNLSTGRAAKWHLYPRRQRLEHYRFSRQSCFDWHLQYRTAGHDIGHSLSPTRNHIMPRRQGGGSARCGG